MINIESTIRPRALALNVSLSAVAYLSGVSKTSISDAANGVVELSHSNALRTDETLKLLEDFAASLAPIRPDFKDVRMVESWLSDFQEKRAQAKAAKVASTEPDPWDLLQELAAGDPDAVCTAHDWSRTELLDRLSAARTQFKKMKNSVFGPQTNL